MPAPPPNPPGPPKPPNQPARNSAIYGGIPDHPPGDLDGQLLSFAEDLRSEGVAIGTSEILDAFEALQHVAWTAQARLQGGARGNPGQVQRRPESLRPRVRPVLLPRRRGPGRPPQDHRGEHRWRSPIGHQPRHAPPADRGRAQGRVGRGTQGPRPPGDRRVRPWRGLRRPRGRRAANQTRARPQNRAPAGPPRNRPETRRPPARPAQTVRAAPETRARAKPDRAHLEPPAQAPAERTRPRRSRPARSRISRPFTEWWHS